MANLSIGDLALSFQTRHSSFRLKTDLQRLGTELTTGVTTNPRAATGGDLGLLAGLERALGSLAAYRVAADEAAFFVGALQRSLETVQDTSSELGGSLLLASNIGHATQIQTAAADAKARFATVISALNTQVADRALLAGVATDGLALADADTMLADLTTAIAAETTAAGIEAAVTLWFDVSGGGFETIGYLGSDTALAPFRVGPDTEASVALTAADPDIRDLMKGYAMAALVAEGALSTDTAARADLLGIAALRLLSSDTALAELRAQIGTVEAQVDTAAARNSAETAALELARNQIIAIDPYKTATELQAVQTQLETLYTLTARLSRLSLADYL